VEEEREREERGRIVVEWLRLIWEGLLPAQMPIMDYRLDHT